MLSYNASADCLYLLVYTTQPKVWVETKGRRLVLEYLIDKRKEILPKFGERETMEWMEL